MSFVNHGTHIHSPIPPLSTQEIRKYRLLTHSTVANQAVPIVAQNDPRLGDIYKRYIRLHLLGLDITNLLNLFTRYPFNQEGILQILNGLASNIGTFLRSDFRFIHNRIFEVLPGLSRQITTSNPEGVDICPQCGQQGHSLLSCHTYKCPQCQLSAPGHLQGDCLAKGSVPINPEINLQEENPPLQQNNETSTSEEDSEANRLFQAFLNRRRRPPVQELFPPSSQVESSPSPQPTTSIPNSPTQNQTTQHSVSTMRGAARTRRRSQRLATRADFQGFHNRRVHFLHTQEGSTDTLVEEQLGETPLVLENVGQSNRSSEEQEDLPNSRVQEE